MGVVLEATHLLLSERVAVKLLLPHAVEDPEHRARFFREAQAAARINSPYVAKVRDVGELESSEPYIVMEFLEGTTLDDLLESEGALSIERTAQLALQACEGLATAHVAGVIHRDIKASNLFLAKAPDGSPLLKLLDFGISKLNRGNSLNESSLTGTQMSMGSPLSMSPEQMRSARDVDHRADIWSLGTVLYRCLSGHEPFQAESLPQLCTLVLEAEVVPLGERAPALPAELISIVNRCLRKSADERYGDVAELARALAPFAGDDGEGEAAAQRCRRILEPGFSGDFVKSARRPSPSSAALSSTATTFGRTQRWSLTPASRRRASAGLLVVALVGVASIFIFSGRRPPAPLAPTAASETVPQPGVLAAALPPVVSSAPVSPSVVASAAAELSASPATTASATPTRAAPGGAQRAPRSQTARTAAASQPTPVTPGPAVDPFSARK